MREIVQREAVETLLKYSYATADIAMRLGKTKIGLELSKNFKNILVSYPNKSIKKSWEDDSEKFGISLDSITFTTHRSIGKHELKSYDCVIIDEIDQISENQWTDIILDLPNKMYGLTGTPPNKGQKATNLYSYCPVVYSKKLEETTGITNKDYDIWVHKVRPSLQRDILLKSGKLWSEAAQIEFYDKTYLKTKSFNLMIKLIQSISQSKTKIQYVKKLAEKMKRGLIFVETIEQCKELGYPAYHTKEKDSEKNLEDFKSGKIDKLVTINQLKAGITFDDLYEVIILHAYSSNNRAQQRIGRALNLIEGDEKKAKIHVICLEDTRDEKWVKAGLEDFDTTKIHYFYGKN